MLPVVVRLAEDALACWTPGECVRWPLVASASLRKHREVA